MGKIQKPAKVKLITGLIYANTGQFDKAAKILEKQFDNPIDFMSDRLNFTYTDYYTAEMGEGLKRVFLSFKKTLSPENLHKAKIKTNCIEQRCSRGGRRTVNIDPGYLDQSKLVLFTTKDYSHRIYLGNGIYAESTLTFRGRSYGPWPWTYPDYATKEYIAIFNSIRDIFRRDICDK
jgi:hypothetical protein